MYPWGNGGGNPRNAAARLLSNGFRREKPRWENGLGSVGATGGEGVVCVR